MIDPRSQLDDETREILVWHRGAWRDRYDRELPADMIERLDAAALHIEDPARNPWPEGER